MAALTNKYDRITYLLREMLLKAAREFNDWHLV